MSLWPIIFAGLIGRDERLGQSSFGRLAPNDERRRMALMEAYPRKSKGSTPAPNDSEQAKMDDEAPEVS